MYCSICGKQGHSKAKCPVGSKQVDHIREMQIRLGKLMGDVQFEDEILQSADANLSKAPLSDKPHPDCGACKLRRKKERERKRRYRNKT